jgi:hypothetical protein
VSAVRLVPGGHRRETDEIADQIQRRLCGRRLDYGEAGLEARAIAVDYVTPIVEERDARQAELDELEERV